MRILCNSLKPFEHALPVLDGEHDVLSLGPDELMAAWLQPDEGWWRRALPDGWVPDVAVFWSPEYLPLPPHPWALPCPVVLWVGDWYIDPTAIRQLAPFVDLVLTDAVGVRALREAGVEHVAECSPWTFDPARDRPDPDAEPLWDVSFVGSLHDAIHPERNRWLDRVLRLDERWRVRVDAGLYGEDYGAFLRRSRIGFNLSLTGDVNMRCFEIAASGSLLLLERGNTEVERWFTPGEECVLYGPDDLEEVVEHLLTHEDERRAIAEAGRRRVQEHAPEPRVRALVRRLEALVAAGPRRCTPTRAQAAQALTFQGLHLRNDHRPFAGLELLLDGAQHDTPGSVARQVNRGMLYVAYAQSDPPEGAEAILLGATEELDDAIAADPSDAVARLDRARLAAATGAPDTAARTLRLLLGDLDAGTAVARPDRLVLRGSLDDLHVAWLTASRLPSPEAELTRLVAGEAAEALAQLVDDRAERIALLRRALRDKGGHVDTRRRLAVELLAAGQADAALAELEAALARKPLLVALWEQQVRALLLCGRLAQARAFADDKLRLSARMPRLEHPARRLAALVSEAEVSALPLAA